MLHDYVPFYFGPRLPMLYTIYKGNAEGFADVHEVMAVMGFYDDLG